MKTQNFRKQVPKNIAVNIFSFASTVLIGLWLAPYLLKHLGIVAYGFIPLAMFFSQYVSVILNSINMSINRFLLIHLQKKEETEANEIFNTSLVIISIFVALQALVMAVVVFDITFFFEIPNNLVTDAMWLFGLTFIGFSISLFRSVFGTSLFAYNRLDILKIIDVVQNVVRVFTIIILFVYDEPSLKYIGIANLIAAISAVIPTLYYFKAYTPQLKINPNLFSKKRVSELSKMSTWILINQVGVLLLGNIDLYLVNNWIGVQATGEYAIVLQFTNIFNTFLMLFTSIVTPVIMIYYANNEFEKLKYFLLLLTKMIIITLIMPLALIIGMSESIISLWLGQQYSYLHEIISFSMLFFIIKISVATLFNITISYNKVKVPALLTLFLGFISIISLYLLITQAGLGLWSVIIVKLIIEIVFGIFIILYVSNILVMSHWKLLNNLGFAILSSLIIISIIRMAKSFVVLDNWLALGMVSVVLFIIVYPIIIFVFLNKEERSLIYYELILKRKRDEKTRNNNK